MRHAHEAHHDFAYLRGRVYEDMNRHRTVQVESVHDERVTVVNQFGRHATMRISRLLSNNYSYLPDLANPQGHPKGRPYP